MEWFFLATLAAAIGRASMEAFAEAKGRRGNYVILANDGTRLGTAVTTTHAYRAYLAADPSDEPVIVTWQDAHRLDLYRREMIVQGGSATRRYIQELERCSIPPSSVAPPASAEEAWGTFLREHPNLTSDELVWVDRLIEQGALPPGWVDIGGYGPMQLVDPKIYLISDFDTPLMDQVQDLGLVVPGAKRYPKQIHIFRAAQPTGGLMRDVDVEGGMRTWVIEQDDRREKPAAWLDLPGVKEMLDSQGIYIRAARPVAYEYTGLDDEDALLRALAVGFTIALVFHDLNDSSIYGFYVMAPWPELYNSREPSLFTPEEDARARQAMRGS